MEPTFVGDPGRDPADTLRSFVADCPGIGTLTIGEIATGDEGYLDYDNETAVAAIARDG